VFWPVWSRAAAEIAEAEEIIVAGYSLPPSDTFFRELVALALAGPAKVKVFRVINPDSAVAGRIREMLGPTLKNRFVQDGSRFEDYIQAHHAEAYNGFQARNTSI
jgi:hypothetical protein